MIAIAIIGWPQIVGADPIVSGNAPVLRNPDYRGELKTDRGAEISMKVARGGTRVFFQAREVALHCEDGTEFRTRFTTRETRLRENRTFDIDRYVFSAGSFADESQAFYRVHGQLTSNGRARGFLLYWADRLEPPGEELGPDCSTLGPRTWSARQIRQPPARTTASRPKRNSTQSRHAPRHGAGPHP